MSELRLLHDPALTCEALVWAAGRLAGDPGCRATGATARRASGRPCGPLARGAVAWDLPGLVCVGLRVGCPWLLPGPVVDGLALSLEVAAGDRAARWRAVAVRLDGLPVVELERVAVSAARWIESREAVAA